MRDWPRSMNWHSWSRMKECCVAKHSIMLCRKRLSTNAAGIQTRSEYGNKDSEERTSIWWHGQWWTEQLRLCHGYKHDSSFNHQITAFIRHTNEHWFNSFLWSVQHSNIKCITDRAVASSVFCGIMDPFLENWDTLRWSEHLDVLYISILPHTVYCSSLRCSNCGRLKQGGTFKFKFNFRKPRNQVQVSACLTS